MTRLRCRLGFHRWEYDSSLEGEAGSQVEVIQTRCRDGCSRWGTWHVVERHPYPDETTPRGAVDSTSEGSADVVKPA